MIHPYFLQSEAWGKFQQSLGKTIIRKSGPGWSYQAIAEKSGGMTRLYLPYGPTVQSEHAFTLALGELTADARRSHASYVRIQPLGVAFSAELIARHKLHKITYSQPNATRVIDLTRPADSVLGDMAQNVRNIYRNYTKKGLTYRESRDPRELSVLLQFLSGVAEHNHITIHEASYLQKQADTLLPLDAARLHFVELEGKPVAAALTYRDDTTVYYAHAAADYEHRALNAGTALVATIIMRAQAEGKRTCDLYGITLSDDPSHRWAGFTKFKKSFGGEIVMLNDTYELAIKPLAYRMYHLARSIRRHL